MLVEFYREGLKILSLDFGLNPEYSPITGCDIVNGEMGWWWDAVSLLYILPLISYNIN